MSLRREEAELRRVLDLSTQQTKALAFLPVVDLSSAPTDDSRDFELRPHHGSTAGTSGAGASMSTPMRPELGRAYRLLSPDDDDGDTTWSPAAPHSSLKDTASPMRSIIRGESPDPIDAFQANDLSRGIKVLEGNAMPTTTTATTSSGRSSASQRGQAAEKPPHSDATSHHTSLSPSTSSPPEETLRRASARVQNIQERKEAEVAERKRKRAERKAREAAERAAGGVSDTSCVDPIPPVSDDGRRNKKKAKTSSGRQRNVESATTSQQSSGDDQANLEPAHVQPRFNHPPKRATGKPAADLPGVEHPPTPTALVDRASPELQASPKVVSPRLARSPIKDQAATLGNGDSAQHAASTPLPTRRPLEPAHSTPTPTSSTSTPNGGRWRTPRNDLAGVLSKFPRVKTTGMSRRLKIAPLHAAIGPGVKALPPPPPKTKKKVEEDEDEDDEDEDGNPKVKVGSREWLMMED